MPDSLFDKTQSPEQLARIVGSIVFGILAVLVLFMKSGPDQRVSKWRRFYENIETPFNKSGYTIFTNEDGSLRRYTKPCLFLLFVGLIILVWCY